MMKNSKTILLVDDDKLIYTKIKRIFEIFKNSLIDDIKLYYCDDIKSAKKFIIENGSPDLILLDYYINEETCDVFLDWMKLNNIGSPVDILTGIRDYPTLRKLVDNGVGKVIAKPFNWLNILENVNNRIQQNKLKEYQNV